MFGKLAHKQKNVSQIEVLALLLPKITDKKQKHILKKSFVFLLIALLSALLPGVMSAQTNDSLTVAERNARQGFNDTIDRLAPDFVMVSLMVAAPTTWQDDVLGTVGHAFLRLQCPVFGLDYCFSYEGENVNDNLYRYMSGKTKMGMFAIPTNEYLDDYRKWNRSVHEYRLSLPPEVEQRLWEIMDNHLTDGIVLRQDLNKYGCAITVVRYVKKALQDIPIVYAPNTALDCLTRREIGYRSLAAHPWIRLGYTLFTDNKADRELPLDEKLIVPADLAAVWQEATLNDEPFATYTGDIVQGSDIDDTEPFLTPLLAVWCLLILTILFAFTRYPYWDWLLLGLQTVAGIVLLFLWFTMRDFGGAAFLLLLLFNPLPLICWRWRHYWGLPYAVLLIVGVVVLLCLPHMLIDPAFLVLALAYAVLFAKEPVQQWLINRK